jgi:hypothetical protein
MPQPGSHRAVRDGRARAWLGFPLAVFAVFAVLVVANLNGSSIGHLAGREDDPALVAGSPRPIRGDEFLISTPIAVSAVRQDFPDEPYIGLTPTAQHAIAHGAPTKSWPDLFRPQGWGYLLLGGDRGLAFHWWMPFLVSLVGLFLLMRCLAIGTWLASALAVVGALTPYTAWWSAPAPALVLGFGALAGAAAISGLRAASTASAVALGVAAGWAATAMFLVLYPPWVISVGLVVAAVFIGHVLDRRPPLTRLLLVAASALAVVAPALLAWYAANRDAIVATTGTYYPGQRISQGGEAELPFLLSAPLNHLLSGDAGTALEESTNLSEISSSWMPLPLCLVALGIVLVDAVRRRDTSSTAVMETGRWTVGAIGAVLAFLLAWALLPLPSWVGTLMMERVTGIRLPLALGFACVLLIGVVGSRRTATPTRWWEAVLWAFGALVTVAMSLWAAGELPIPHDALSTPGLVLSASVVAVGFALIAARRLARAAATVLAVFCLWSWSLVNPLYHGLGALDTNPLTEAMRPVAEAEPGVKVQVYGNSLHQTAVRASGAQVLSGATFYPNIPLMERIAPTQRNAWNNFVRYRWAVDPTATPARIVGHKGSSQFLYVDPCAPAIRELGATWAVSDSPVDVPCFEPVDQFPYWDWTMYRYRIRG